MAQYKQSISNVLINAATNDDLMSVQTWVRFGADCTYQTEATYPALHIAAQRGSLPIMQVMLDSGANVEARCLQNDATPMFHAAKGGHLNVVEELVMNRDADINACCQLQKTPLYVASESGHLAVVEYLLKHGANVDSKNVAGETPVYVAAQNGHLNVVKHLVSKHADITIESRFGWSPLFAATENGHLEIVKFLWPDGAKKYLDNTGDTPLHVACYKGHNDILGYFLRCTWLGHMSRVNIKNKKGWTALHVAANNVLLKDLEPFWTIKGLVHVNAVAKNGQTPLHLAASQGHVEVIKQLLLNNADMDAETKTGDTALTLACKKGHKDSILLLLDKGGKYLMERVNKAGKFPFECIKDPELRKELESKMMYKTEQTCGKRKEPETRNTSNPKSKKAKKAK